LREHPPRDTRAYVPAKAQRRKEDGAGADAYDRESKTDIST